MKKRILSLLMAVALTATTIPMMAIATDTTEVSGQETEAPSVDTEEQNMEEPSDEAKENQPEAINEDATDTSDNASSDKTDEVTEDTVNEEDTEEGVSEPISGNVVTLGENLSEDQRELMYKYFGVSADEVHTIIVTHADEVSYMEGIATAEQIGATTNSCAYVEPTKSGGIKVKTANLNFVTSEMIASTLTTAGMENCNVVAACPFEVSGTGALTGIIMAYEAASGETLEEGKKEAAMEEMFLLGELAELVGEETATELLNIAKTEIIDKGITDPEEIGAIVDDVAAQYGAELTEAQREQIVKFLQMMSQFDYDLGSLQKTFDNLNKTVDGLTKVWNNIKSFFFGSNDGILSHTNDEVLGEDVITDSTEAEAKYSDGLLTRIINFFKGEE